MNFSLIFFIVATFIATLVEIRATSIGQHKSIQNAIKNKNENKPNRIPSLVASSSEKEAINWRGPACIIGGALGHLALGTIYCWGNFISYVPQYLRFFDGQINEGSQPDALYVLPCTVAAMAMSMPFGPIVQKALGAPNAFLLGCMTAALSVLIASYQKSLTMFILFYSIMFGFGTGIAYTAPMNAGWKWMPGSKGLVSGGVLSGFGSGGFIFSLIGSKSINPDSLNAVNGQFPDSVYAGFPAMLRKLSVLYAAVSLVGYFLITEPKTKPAVADKSGKVVEAPLPAGVPPKKALSTSQFWLFWLMIITSGSAGLNTAATYKQFAGSSPALAGDGFQSLVGGVGALFNGFGRLAWGSVIDIIGFKNSMIILTLFQAISMLTYSSSTFSKPTFFANTCALFFCLAGNFALMPSAVMGVFGPRAGSTIYGMLYSGFAIASIGGGIMTKALVKKFGWNFVFQLMVMFSLVGTSLVGLLKPLTDLYPGSIA